jgi:hypothetical protein
MSVQVSKNARWAVALLGVILVTTASGCGGPATVTGKVTYLDRPVTYGSVVFLSADKTARSTAIEPDGTYTVERAPRGTVAIAVISRNPSKGRKAKSEGGDHAADVKQWLPLPPKFEDPSTSGLGCMVDANRVHHDIELK